MANLLYKTLFGIYETELHVLTLFLMKMYFNEYASLFRVLIIFWCNTNKPSIDLPMSLQNTQISLTLEYYILVDGDVASRYEERMKLLIGLLHAQLKINEATSQPKP